MKNFLKIALSTAIFLSASASFAADVNDMLALESSFQQLSESLNKEEQARKAAVSAEEDARVAADTQHEIDIAKNAADIQAEEQARKAAVSAEEDARVAADTQHEIDIAKNAANIQAEEQARKAAVSAEEDARVAADTQHEIDIAKNAANIATNKTAIGDMNFTNTQYIKNDRDLSSAVRTLDANFAQMSNRLDDLDSKVEKHHKEMKRGFASLAAMTRLVPNAKSKCNTQLALGMGHYRGTTGVAVGLFHYVDNNTLINAGVGYAGHDSTTFGVGITFGF